jgi:hypothetical protein
MKSYYSILELASDETLFLGKMPLLVTEDGVALDTYDGQKPIAGDGTVPAVWVDGRPGVPLPDGVDTTDPFQVAPMASFYERPYGTLADVVDGEPETVHVFTADTDDETPLSDVDGAEYYEKTTGESDDGTVRHVDRGYEWDNAAISTDGETASSELSSANFLIGFVDGQDMHDPYAHLGVSAAEGVLQAFYDVLTALDGTPLWTPEAYTVDEHQTFEASAVLNSDYKLPSEA